MKTKLLLFLVALLAYSQVWAEDYGLQICGTKVTDANKDNLIALFGAGATGTATYDSETQTLELNNVKATNDDKYMIRVEKSLTIKATGENILTKTSGAANILYVNMGPMGSNSITFTGSGSLTMKHTAEGRRAVNFSGSYYKITFDHTTVDIQDNIGINGGYNNCTLTVDESTLKAYEMKNVRVITLKNATIQSPVGARSESGAIMLGSDIATNVVIVPDTRVNAGIKWDAASDWDYITLEQWKGNTGTKGTLYSEYPKQLSLPVFVNPYNVAVTYASSNLEVATINAETGAITFIKPGSSTITATFAGNTEYKPAVASYIYYVGKGNTKFSFAEESYKATVGTNYQSPAPTIKNCLDEDVTGFTLKYESSDETVATVSETGEITPLKKGETTIRVWMADNDFYLSGTTGYYNHYGKYTLNVVDPGTTTLKFPKEEYRVGVNGTFTAPTLENIDNVPVTYSSSDKSVATVDETTGAVTILKAGETIITAAFKGNDDFKAASASYKLIVQKISASVAFPKLEYKADINQAFEAPTATTTPEGLKLTYSSSDETVATVNAETGAVTLKKAGETTITAAFEGNETYNSVTGSYKLTVEKGNASVAFAKAEYTTVYGETFEAPTATTTPEGLKLTYSSSDETVATVNAETGAVTLKKAGETTITATFEGNDTYNAMSGSYKLTVDPAMIDFENVVTINGQTLYKPTEEVAELLENSTTNEIALSAGANCRMTVDDTGVMTFTTGEDLQLAVLGVKEGQLVTITFTGTIVGDGEQLVEQTTESRRASGDLELSSGTTYKATADADILLTLNLTDEVTITNITVADAPTGISFVKTNNERDVRYNLRGQRVDESYKGIVIINGKKVVIK